MSQALNLMLGLGSPAPQLWIDDCFSAYTYTGNGSTQTITNGIDLAGKGGMVWTKNRDSAYEAQIYDSANVANKYLVPSTTAANATTSGTVFNSNGFTVNGNDNSNATGQRGVSWTFRNAPKFFDVVTWTGDGTANRVLPHSLGIAPGMIAIKATDLVSNWQVFHRSLAAGQELILNLTNAATSNNNIPAASSTTFTVGSGSGANVNGSGYTYVAYLFAHDTSATGLIQCGSITLNASVPVAVNLGYEPQFVLIKASSTTGNWNMYDSARGLTNPDNTAGKELKANNSAAEVGGSGVSITPTATGFTAYDGSTATYIYLAIRRGPMKLPTSGTQVFNAIARTGTGAAATVTGVGFPPDLIMSRARDTSGIGAGVAFNDRLRGTNSYLLSSTTSSENQPTGDYVAITSHTMDGVVIGGNDWNGWINGIAARPYINHFFRRYPGVLQEVCDTGTGSAHTIDHGLAAVPEMMVRKGRSGATAWAVYHSGIANTEKLVLNTTAAKATDTTAWNSTTPTSTVFTVGTGSDVNTNAATYVTYLFATLAGVSCVTSYVGDGTTGRVINCGFSAGARFALIKATSTTGSWWVFDSTRGIVASTDFALALNSTAAEVTSADAIDPSASGFIVNEEATCSLNTNGVSYIVLAFS